jgi:hypothetical protein
MASVNLLGLGFDIVGATVLSVGLFLTKAEAIELGVSRVSGDTVEETSDSQPSGIGYANRETPRSVSPFSSSDLVSKSSRPGPQADLAASSPGWNT